MSITISKKNSVAVVTVDNPPVNALSTHVRQGLLEALTATEADESMPLNLPANRG